MHDTAMLSCYAIKGIEASICLVLDVMGLQVSIPAESQCGQMAYLPNVRQSGMRCSTQDSTGLK